MLTTVSVAFICAICFYMTSVSAVTEYSLEQDSVCSLIGSKKKIELDPEVDKAIVIREKRYFDYWLGKHKFNCVFQIKISSKFSWLKKSSENGIFVVIQSLSLRRDESTGKCIDYVQFIQNNGTKSKKFCGKINVYPSQIPPGFEDLPEYKKKVTEFSPNAYIDGTGKLETVIYVANQRLNDDESLDLTLVYTGYIGCYTNMPNYVPCGRDKCIRKELFRDDFFNCPYTNCLDEDGCFIQAGEEGGVIRSSKTGSRVVIGSVATIFIAFFVFICCLWTLRHFKTGCWKEPSQRPIGQASRMEMNNRQDSLTDVHITNDQRFDPSAPVDNERSRISSQRSEDLPPSYDSLFPENITK